MVGGAVTKLSVFLRRCSQRLSIEVNTATTKPINVELYSNLGCFLYLFNLLINKLLDQSANDSKLVYSKIVKMPPYTQKDIQIIIHLATGGGSAG